MTSRCRSFEGGPQTVAQAHLELDLGRNTNCRMGLNFYPAGAPEQPTSASSSGRISGLPRRGSSFIADDDPLFSPQPVSRRAPLGPSSSALKEGANGVADHTSSSFAAYQTGAGSMSKRRSGGIVEDALPAGPTLWRRLGFG
jgi:hypothetical protein